MKNLLLLGMFLVAQSAQAIGFYCQGDTLFCFAPSGLKLRDQPNGQALTVVPTGASVIVDTVDNYLSASFDNILGQWVRVRYKSYTGYVFDGYLSRLPPPGISDTSMQQYVDRHFKPVGRTAKRTNRDCKTQIQGEGSYAADIRFYQHGNLTLKTIDYSGWEWGHETYEFDYVSLEEVWLLLLNLYKKELKGKNFGYPKLFDHDFSQPVELKASLLTPDDIDDGGYWDVILRYNTHYNESVRVILSYGY
jgi:hypothetical protein